MQGPLERLADPECMKCHGNGWYFQSKPVVMDWTGDSGDASVCPCTKPSSPEGETE